MNGVAESSFGVIKVRPSPSPMKIYVLVNFFEISVVFEFCPDSTQKSSEHSIKHPLVFLLQKSSKHENDNNNNKDSNYDSENDNNISH